MDNNYAAPIIGFSGVIVGGIIATLKDWFFERRRQNKIKQYTALQLLFLIEEFIDGCTSVVLDNGESDGQINDDGCRYPQITPPTINYASIDVNWTSIPIELAYDLLNLPVEINNENRYLSNVSEYESTPPDHQELFDARVLVYSKFGIKANSIASSLRKICNAPIEAIAPTKWNRMELIRNAKLKAEASIASRNRTLL